MKLLAASGRDGHGVAAAGQEIPLAKKPQQALPEDPDIVPDQLPRTCSTDRLCAFKASQVLLIWDDN